MTTMKPKTGPLALALAGALALVASAGARADTVVYSETCGNDAHTSWNLTCRVDKNTLAQHGFGTIKSVTVCASFDNRGGFNAPAIVVHNGTESRDKPTDLFDTVKFAGDEGAGTMSWTGTGSRQRKGLGMRGELRLTEPTKSVASTYVETLTEGKRVLGQLSATCGRMADE